MDLYPWHANAIGLEKPGYLSSVKKHEMADLLFEKFLNLMSAKEVAQLNSNETDRGFFAFEDFKRAFNSVSSKLSEKIIFEATREVDQDSNGCISFKEFESAMKYGQEVSPVYFA
ncbi:LOW QUALITY PROTEIN: EF-hand calcium-binding domain-containing protein 11 [Acridotheres tristis]